MIRLLIGLAIVIPLGLDLYLPIPEDNALTAAKVRLGRDLFRNAILSRDRTLACASCHDPRRAFTDGRSLAVGVDGKVGTRNAPTLINRVYGRSQFWDGRAHSLEQQVLEPIENPRELGAGVDTAVRRLVSSPLYRLRFRVAFGRDVNAQDRACSRQLCANDPGGRLAIRSVCERDRERALGRGPEWTRDLSR